MATFVWCEIVCDKCGVAICGKYSNADRIPRKQLKLDAKRLGAVFSGNIVYCCMEHFREATNQHVKDDA